MNCIECIAALHEHIDGKLAPERIPGMETHLARCPACRAEAESLRALRRATAALPAVIAPRRDLWPLIAAELENKPPRAPARESRDVVRHIAPLHWLAPLAVAAAIVLIASVAQRDFAPRAAWQVAALDGTPRVGVRSVRSEATFRVGQWLETDAQSRARIAVGSIGEVEVEPNSRLRLTNATPDDHRIELARGTLHAFIYAPPRLFFVETPSATAIDLGCAYTLTVDEAGNGELRVESGYVSLQRDGREAIIPAGLSCLTREGIGPGTPFAGDAPESLRAALARFDFDAGGADALDDVLRHARADDAIMLWHLLTRTSGEQRGIVFDTFARLRPPPPGVTRPGILADETAMLRSWANALGLGAFAD